MLNIGLMAWLRLLSSRKTFVLTPAQLWVAQDPGCSLILGYISVMALGSILGRPGYFVLESSNKQTNKQMKGGNTC